MRAKSSIALVTWSLLAATVGAQPAAGPSPADQLTDRAPSETRASGQPLRNLQSSAQHLRQSIQALAQKEPGLERDYAIAKAKEALQQTQQAMLALPPELRPAPVRGANYEASVQELIRSADSLQSAIRSMGEAPGARRSKAIAQANQALWATQIALATAHQPTPPTSTMSAGTAPTPAVPGSAPGAAPTETLLALLPSSQATGNQLANGCWVRFYDDKNFQGPSLTLVGPVDMPSMAAAGGVWRNWDSAVAGPRATVTTYDKENYGERTATLRAGESVPDLRDRHLGWHEQVKSARVFCTA